jgi:hypothetical protein
MYRSIYKFPEVANLEKWQVDALQREIKSPISTIIVFIVTVIAVYWLGENLCSYIYRETNIKWLAVLVPSVGFGVYVYVFMLVHTNTYVRKEIRRRVSNYT